MDHLWDCAQRTKVTRWDLFNIYISRLWYDVSVRLSETEVHAGNTAAAPASEVEAIIRSPTNMAAADVAAVEGRGHLALC